MIYCFHHKKLYLNDIDSDTTPEILLEKLKESKSNRPGGYKTGDIDAHGKLSAGKNRSRKHSRNRADGNVQSHHPVQNEWAKRFAKKYGLKYDENKAAAILLPSNSGESHAKISAAQRARRRRDFYNTSIEYEFNQGYRELIEAGVSEKDAKKAMRRAYKYFDSIGAFKVK